jgi:hypothetical protein
MAGALTYRTIFGLVPLLMVSMLAFRMFGDMEVAGRHLQSAAYAFFNYEVDATAPEATAFKQELDERVLDLMRSVSGLSYDEMKWEYESKWERQWALKRAFGAGLRQLRFASMLRFAPSWLLNRMWD